MCGKRAGRLRLHEGNAHPPRARYVDGDEKFSPLPNAFLIDGGLGHVRVCKEVLDSFGLTTPCFGMVKDDRHAPARWSRRTARVRHFGHRPRCSR